MGRNYHGMTGWWTFYVGCDGHWYLRLLENLMWRSPWRKPEGWGA